MRKIWIVLFSIIIIISAILLGTYLYGVSNRKIANKNNVISAGNKVSEEIVDECTEEWEEMSNETKSEIMETNSGEEKISPNCTVILKKYYTGCKHISKEYITISQELVNKTKDELQEKYPEWIIEEFSSSEITLYKECEGECGEHYVLRESDGKIVVYKKDTTGKESVFEETGISVEYLTESDKESVKSGISVNGRERLNQLIEDFE